MDGLVIRPFEDGDLPATVRLWHRAKRRAFPYVALIQSHTLKDDEHTFRRVLVGMHDLWVAEQGDHIVGFMAIRGSVIDQLYVHPACQRCGIGTALLDHAKALLPEGFTLYTFQRNTAGRRFYEKHGLVAIRFGVSPAPESEPDVQYAWEPKRLETGFL